MCFPSTAPMQLGKFAFLKNWSAIATHFSSVGSGISVGRRASQRTIHVSRTIDAMVLLPILKLNAIAAKFNPVARYLQNNKSDITFRFLFSYGTAEEMEKYQRLLPKREEVPATRQKWTSGSQEKAIHLF